MNEKSPDSRGGGEGSTVVVAAVLTVIVVLAAAVLVGGVFIFYFAVPFSDVSRPGPPTAVTTTQSAVTIAQYDPVEIEEGVGEPVRAGDERVVGHAKAHLPGIRRSQARLRSGDDRIQ